MNLTRTEQYDFLPRFYRLAIANILSNLMIPLAGLISVAFLGHLQEIDALAGVCIANILFNLVYLILEFLRMGTTGLTAQAVGADDQEAALLVGLRNGLIALGLGIVLLILQYPLREVGFSLLSADIDVKAAGIDYFNARIWGAPAVLLNFVLIGWLLGREENSKVVVLSVIGNAANIILNYTLQCHNLSFFKSLKFKSEQGFHFFFVTQMSLRDGSRDSIFKIGKIFIILTI
jgi:MATE family multidrug resistance protein